MDFNELKKKAQEKYEEFTNEGGFDSLKDEATKTFGNVSNKVSEFANSDSVHDTTEKVKSGAGDLFSKAKDAINNITNK